MPISGNPPSPVPSDSMTHVVHETETPIYRTPKLDGSPTYMDDAVIGGKIGSLITTITSTIEDSLSLTKHRRTWLPPKTVDEETREFYRELKIPLFDGKPSLLLHRLDGPPSPYTEHLFSGSDFQILCNVSGSGKTRLLFEGLCRYWGFYFVATRGPDGIGPPDLEFAIGDMKKTSGWVNDIFKEANPKDAHDKNQAIADRLLSKMFLARWIILHTFVSVAKRINGGNLPPNLKHDWLLFQLQPNIRTADLNTSTTDAVPRRRMTVNLFIFAISQLSGVHPDLLTGLIAKYSSDVTEIIGNDFFLVIDEAQAAGEEHMGAFQGSNGDKRPVLRPIVRYLDHRQEGIHVIVSGTGFSLSLFKEVVASGVAKGDATKWDVVHSTGHFFNADAQASYVNRYLYSTTPRSESRTNLDARIWRWLRGRHRFTVRYLEAVLTGPWKDNWPACPHNLLNAYVKILTGYDPRDGNETILKQEEDSPPLEIPTFDWRKLQNDAKLLDDLSLSISNFITQGEPLMCLKENTALVQYGIAHFVDANGDIMIEEPLALVAIMQFFESNSRPLDRVVKFGLQFNKGLGFEEAVLLAVTRLLEEPTKLSNIFKFHGKRPPWADHPAQIVTLQGGNYSPFSIDKFIDPASLIAYRANTPEDVVSWLESGEAGWCIPSRYMGPDLMARLRLNGKILLLVIQAKCYSSGNIDTVSASVTANAIRSLIPARFFGSLVTCYKPYNWVSKRHAQKRIDAMLTAINQGSSWTGSPYNILRVVVAFPLAVKFDARSTYIAAALGEDKHPLAIFDQVTLMQGLSARPDGASCVKALIGTVRKVREEDEAENENGRKKRKV